MKRPIDFPLMIIGISLVMITQKEKSASIKSECYSPNIDSLKWMMYSLNFEQNANHFKYDSIASVSVLECEIDFYFKDTTMSDTIIYYFSFYKGEVGNIFIPKGLNRVGIGFSCITSNFFPVSHHFIPTQNMEMRDEFNKLFKIQNDKFTKYLKNYTGKLSTWLKSEAQKRRIIKE